MNHNFQYQQTGIEWLKTKRLALLADEQGLGKSRQVILAADELNLGKIIIIGPAVSRLTWADQIKKWTTLNRKVRIITKRSEKPESGDEIIIVSFDYASTCFTSLVEFRADLLVVDESHFIKSLDAKRTQAILAKGGIIHSVKRTWFLTGTPMPNHPGELWPMMISFGLTKLNYDAFITKFCDTYHFQNRMAVSGAKRKSLPELRELLAPAMLRRMKKDVLKDLPAVIAGELFVEGDLSELPIIKEEHAAYLSALRISDPNQQMKALELLAGSVATLRRYCVMQKLDPVLEILKDELKNRAYKKIIIFCVHKEAVEKIMFELNEFFPVSITGSIDAVQRQRNIDLFQNDDTCRVFVGNIQAAGTNITLTAADQMIFLEQSWVPGDNAQAIARANRIGQKSVLNIRIVSIKDTIDEKVNTILFKKSCDIGMLLG